MADFLKSAASYFSSTNPSNGVGENPLIGTVVNVNSVQLRIKRQIGEGLLSVFFSTLHFKSQFYSFIAWKAIKICMCSISDYHINFGLAYSRLLPFLFVDFHSGFGLVLGSSS